MNTLGLVLIWTALQVSAFCLAGALLYLVARRRNPARGAWAAGAALAVAVGLSALALSPWPRWWAFESDTARAAADNPFEARPTTSRSAGQGLAPRLMAGPSEPRKQTESQDAVASGTAAASPPSAWRAVLERVRDELSSSSAPAPSAVWRWPAWLAVAVMAGCGLAVARLLFAVAAVRRYVRAATPVNDLGMIALLDEIRGELGCARPIELREATANCSPSTIGWLRPAIVLPNDWRAWNENERRAVLAHEVAHVARGDFGTAVLAQLGVALHFYNPLVHWLAARLRLEQEMAADVCGARVAGGRQPYLTTLAEMALRATNPPLAWAARPFLPTRGTLMRRIEMLHARKQLPAISISRATRMAFVVVLLAIGGLVVGIRGPSGETAAQAALAEAAADDLGVHEPLSLDYVPDDAEVVVAARPSELTKLDSLKAPLGAWLKAGMFRGLDLPPSEIEELKIADGTSDPNTGYRWNILVVRSRKPHDWTRFGNHVVGTPEEVTVGDQKYFRDAHQRPSPVMAYWLPDDRTIVLGTSDRLTKTFSLRGPDHKPSFADPWKTVAPSPFAALARGNPVQAVLSRADPNIPAATFSEPAVASGTIVDGQFVVEARLACHSDDIAKAANAVLQKIIGDGKLELQAQILKIGSSDESIMPRIMLGLLDATELTAKGPVVQSRTNVRPELALLLKDAVGPAQTAARRNTTANRMKQLGIAMQNYHGLHKHFPPAVVIGPDGKTPHSWRVELLPLMERQDLYDQYKMDEPWDSEHNRKLIAEGAELFSVPGDTPSEDCAFFLLVGPGTTFDPAQPRRKIRDIVDGTSKTIGIVEAKRSIPWTKPEDIAYDPAKPLPKLGGYFQGGFHIGALDASVHFLPDTIDEKTLRELITCAGREPTTWPQ